MISRRAFLLASLLAFNVGVELGQLAIVALFLPLAFLSRDTAFYRQLILYGGSSVIAALRRKKIGQVQRAEGPHFGDQFAEALFDEKNAGEGRIVVPDEVKPKEEKAPEKAAEK